MFKGPVLQQAAPSPAIVPYPEGAEAEPEVTLDTQPVEAADRFAQEEEAEEDRFNVEPIPTDTTAGPLDSTKPSRPRGRKTTSKKPPARATNRSKKPGGSQSRGKSKV